LGENAMLGQQQKLHPRRFRFRHGVTANHDSCPAKPDLCPISRGLGITEGLSEKLNDRPCTPIFADKYYSALNQLKKPQGWNLFAA
jgi:hypothetical protein